jgi:predicted esterase
VLAGWSDIFGLSVSDREDREGFDESAARVNAIVQQEIDKGIDPRRIVLAGFSQGGAVVLHAALRSPHALGGCAALSTWLPLREDYPAATSSAAKGLKILQVRILLPYSDAGEKDERCDYAVVASEACTLMCSCI